MASALRQRFGAHFSPVHSLRHPSAIAKRFMGGHGGDDAGSNFIFLSAASVIAVVLSSCFLHRICFCEVSRTGWRDWHRILIWLRVTLLNGLGCLSGTWHYFTCLSLYLKWSMWCDEPFAEETFKWRNVTIAATIGCIGMVFNTFSGEEHHHPEERPVRNTSNSLTVLISAHWTVCNMEYNLCMPLSSWIAELWARALEIRYIEYMKSW